MADFTWEDPPTTHRGAKGVWAERLAPLREHPQRWACFGERHITLITRINRGQVSGVEPGEFQARSVNQSNGRCTLYVRYVGKPDLTAVSA
jgi:hypothetical protein